MAAILDSTRETGGEIMSRPVIRGRTDCGALRDAGPADGLVAAPDYPLRRFPEGPRQAGGRPARLAAKTIGGLDDVEYVGGALWAGLTHLEPRETRTSRSASSRTG